MLKRMLPNEEEESEQTLTKGSETLSKLLQISCIKPQHSLL